MGSRHVHGAQVRVSAVGQDRPPAAKGGMMPASAELA